MSYYYGKPKAAPMGWMYVAWAGTKEIKDELKELGCKFCGLDPDGVEKKGYYSPPENHDEAMALLPDPTDMTKWSPVRGSVYGVKDALKANFGAKWIMVVPKHQEKNAQEYLLGSTAQ